MKEPIKEDSTLLMNVKVAFHEVYGISLQILDIDPNYSLGELHRERTETLQRLQKENLINLNQQLPFPLLPKRIAVISADSSKGLSDFMQVINQNTWGYSFFTMLFPAYLQGDLAAQSIINQLERVKKVRHHFDLVVIVRGGGGEVGLSCYNNYELCKHIASFPLPVLTGIGHSTNLTVAEMVSFRNAITPTELGEFLLQAFHNFSVPITNAIKTLGIYSSKAINENGYALNTISVQFKNHVQMLIKEQSNEVKRTGALIQSHLKHYFYSSRDAVKRNEQQISRIGLLALQANKNLLASTENKLKPISHTLIEMNRSRLTEIGHQVRLLDPENVLARGYSITTINGAAISDVVTVGDQITTKTLHYTFESVVSKKLKNERKD